MNKQQLASTIWQSANQMRSKIEANEYKDYILGFMFYKYLSDREISFLKGEKYSDEDIKKVTADDEKLVKHISENIGYFIAYEDLFSSWLSKGDDFDVSDVRDALSNFDANIEPTYKKLFENIFKTLQSGLSKLGETSTKQTKSIKALLKLIKRIPMDGKQDYDVLGFIYEYLISMFAANAGKKAGEFYTPHEVSVLMSEIVANHLKDREHIKIYDPTSGSGSLLINIGASMAQYIEGENKIDYYAQELKENTYNLKPAVNSRILQLQMEFEFPEESLEAKMKRVMLLMEEESELKKVIKAQKIELEAATIETIKNLDEEDALRLLELKWIEPIVSGLGTLPDDVITALVSEVENLNSKYATTYSDIEVKKESAAGSLIQMIDGLSGSKDDLDGLAEFKKYMGVKNEKE